MCFSVTKTAQSFIRPSEPTPSETLGLSSLDRVPGWRTLIKSLYVFKHGQQPAKVIREALSKALVSYYPFAGRFIVSNGDDMVECNGEGVWFVEATVNCTLEDVKYLDREPLMISEDDLFPEPPPGIKPLDVPTMMQIAEFTCGGYVVGFVFNHAIADGIGAAQFMRAIGDFARGNTAPNVKPVWSRNLIPNPPMPPPEASFEPFSSSNLCFYNFDLTMDYVTKMKSIYFESAQQNCTAFDIFAATVWQMRCRAINIHDTNTPVYLHFPANIRHLLTPEILPQGGYYGNCIYPVTVSASSDTIVNGKVVDIVNLIRDGKSRLPNEVALWKIGELKRDPWIMINTYEALFITDTTYLGYIEVDHGWGKPIHITRPLREFDGCHVYIARPLVTTLCVKEEHLSAFQEQVNNLM